jgi:hypothetical protein
MTSGAVGFRRLGSVAGSSCGLKQKTWVGIRQVQALILKRIGTWYAGFRLALAVAFELHPRRLRRYD